MKKEQLLILNFTFLGMIAVCGCFEGQNAEVERRNFKRQLGTYEMNLSKTNLNRYFKDSNLYRRLTITFNADSTFSMNMSVPFFFDSCGTWEAGGGKLDDWNVLRYKANPDINTQFDMCCDSDSTFYLNSVTPKNGECAINKIYFRKIK